jgi:hypothetical protein
MKLSLEERIEVLERVVERLQHAQYPGPYVRESFLKEETEKFKKELEKNYRES